MRKARMKIRGETGVYHCMTRVVNREMLFNGGAKEVLRKMLWQVADFSGVEVLAYCVMTNHFHVLVRVPDGGAVTVTDRELMRRYRVLYPKPTEFQTVMAEVLEGKLKAGGEEAERIRRQLLARMHDISEYMKTLKQRYSVWYNHTHGRMGTLWAERFKSTLIENADIALRTVAAYIDLNPVRAGIVEDPKEYRWSSYGEAVGGSLLARAGLMAAMNGPQGTENWRSASAKYRRILYNKGSLPAPGKGGAGAMIPEGAWKREMERGGKLPVAAALRCRVRYFTDGAVVGSEAFVEEQFGVFRQHFGPRRRSGARKMKGSDWDGLRVLRSLRKDVFS